MEIIGRDKIVQNGEGSSISIDNQRTDIPLAWHGTWWGKITIAVVATLMAGGLLYIFGWN